MIKSMTAFARLSQHEDWGQASWELRTVNHRYLEISLRLPEELRGLDSKVREHASKRLGRGKLDAGLRFHATVTGDTELQFDRVLARKLVEACDEIGSLGPNIAPATATDILRWPGVLENTVADFDALQEPLLALLDRALDDLVATREREGEKLRTLLETRCDAIEQQVLLARNIMPEILTGIRERLTARLEELDASLDQERIEQEMVLLLNKTDVTEELDRLDAHISEVRHVLNKDEPIGRRLDFLMQELNREANTLGSKSAHAGSTAISVELKVLIEQMREQVQNIE